jgi:YVTN family beta-propeller protein
MLSTTLALGIVLLQTGYQAFPTSTGRQLTPVGTHAEVGGFPVNLAVSPDRRWFAITNTGIDQRLTIVSAATGQPASFLAFNGRDPKGAKDGLYWGLQFFDDPQKGLLLFAAHGAADRVDAFTVSPEGKLAGPIEAYNAPRPGLAGARMPNFLAGIALDSKGEHLFAVGNQTFSLSNEHGTLVRFRRGKPQPEASAELPGFPLDLALLTKGPHQDRKLYVTSEREGTVSVLDPTDLRSLKTIRTGEQPTHLLLNRDQSRLFVANTNSDTVSVIDTATDEVVQTLLVRPAEQRGLSGCSPLGLALSPDETTLYVALSDLNAVAVVDLKDGYLSGLIPTGWYPTAVAASDTRLFVTAAKGVVTKRPNLPTNPNDKYGMIIADSGPNIRANLHGVVSTIFLPSPTERKKLTAQVLRNNRFAQIGRPLPTAPKIEHVIYIIKENRTYDQIFGDEPRGNHQPNLTLYGRDITPNEHALAERFVQLDNFFACAEMSADGWSWTTAGIASEYVQRNAQYDYSGRQREYDYEGQNNGTPADAKGLRNVNDPPGGYLWDNALRHNVEFKNYGMYIAAGIPIRDRDGKPVAEDNSITMRAFQGRADLDYRMFDLDYAESEAWEKHGQTYPKRRPTFGSHGARSRIEEWRQDYARLVAENKVPPLMFVRFGNNHTAGTSPGSPTPSAMIADNDYAVGQLVETVSHGPLWKSTAIIIVEDDAQGGYDHVDGHRSIAFVVSPYTKRRLLDSRYYNTDSALRTVEWLLGLPPSNQFTATATPLLVFGEKPENAEPFDAILPAASIFKANTALSYRAADSARLFHTYREESAADRELADILWGDAKGTGTPVPKGAKSLGKDD